MTTADPGAALRLQTVEFHTRVPDLATYAARLLRRACRQGQRVLVTAPAPLRQQLSRLLWTLDARDFLPHLLLDASGPVARAQQAALTPLWLAEAAAGAGVRPHEPAVVLNLRDDAAEDALQHARLIELVADDPEAVDRGRRKWRRYQQLGLTPAVRHDAAAA